MLDFINNTLAEMPVSASVIISISLMIFGGFAMTRLTKLARLPNVTAYILAGIILGPYCFNLIPQSTVDGMDFISDIALAFIAFGVGQFFKLPTLKKSGMRVIVITLFEAVLTFVLVFAACYFILGLDFAFSVVLAALSSATASASTMMTIRQTGAKGEFVDTLLQVIAFDNVISLLAYSIAISVALASISDSKISAGVIWLPILKNIAAIILGGLFGLLLKFLMPSKRTTDNRLIISIGVLFTFCGICVLLDVSPLLGCMMIGTVYINLTNDEKLFLQLNYFNPPLLLLFFVRSGLSFKLGSLAAGVSSMGKSPLWVIGLTYFAVRIAGKYAGAFLGSFVVKKPPEVRNYLGMALIPQAGVAIGLAAMGARTLGGETGAALETIILASSVMYELIGPVLAKLSLSLSKSYSDTLEELAPIEATEVGKLSEVELLIERIRKIREELPRRAEEINPAEQAFTEAAEEQLEAMQIPRRSGMMNRLR